MMAGMASPSYSQCHCNVPDAFSRHVFDPGGIRNKRCGEERSPNTLQRWENHVSASYYHQYILSDDHQHLGEKSFELGLREELLSLRKEPIELGLGNKSAQFLPEKSAVLGSDDDTVALGLCHELLSLLERGHLDEVLDGLLHMYEQGIVPPQKIYWSFLKVCNKKKALFQAKRLHSHLALHGWEFVSSLGEYLVSTLFKCSGFELALQVFHMLPHRTIISWKAAISGYADYGRGQDTLALFTRMQEEGVEPDKYTFVSLFKACGSIPNLDQGKALHADAQRRCFHLDAFVGSALVYMYGKCGSIVEAENVFDGSWQRDVVSWNAMLSAYTDHGEAQKALRLYRQMQEEGMRPNVRTFVAVVSACCILGEKEETVMICLAIGEALHADARRKGFDSDVFFGNTLMSMYGKCGNITAARKVFEDLSQRSVVTWTAMLKVYLEQGQEETSLQLYRQMQEEGVCPDERTLVVALQACCLLAKKEEVVAVEGQLTKVMSLSIGQALHSDARSMSYDLDVFVGSSLVGMYGMCGSIVEGENVFTGLSQRNHVCFNAMLSAYLEQGEGEAALWLYRQMWEEGVRLDERTFVIALQACCMLAEEEKPVVINGRSSKLMSLEIGRALHADVRRKGFRSDVFISYTLMSMYRKCGSVVEAKNLFSQLSTRSSISWIEMLSSYVEEGEEEKALQLYKHMQDEGVSPNKWTFVMALEACCAIAEKEGAVVDDGKSVKVLSLKIGQALHFDALKKGCNSDAFVGSTLLTMYNLCGDIVEAENVFDGLSQHDIVSWNAMLSAYLEQGDGEKVLNLYRKLQDEFMLQNECTLVIALQACCMLAEKKGAALESQTTQVMPLDIGKALHADARRKGFDSLAFVCSTIVSMYGKCGSIMEAENVFGRLSQHDVVSWTVLLSAYIECGEGKKALQLFRQMQEEGVSPDERTFVVALEACCRLAEKEEAVVVEGQPIKVTCLEIGQALHADSLSMGCNSDAFVCSNLVSVYDNCGSLAEAEIIFSGLPKHSIMLWNAMLSAYVNHGEGEKALQLYSLLQEEVGVILSDFTIVCVLQACSVTGNMEICRQVHFLMECVGYDPSSLMGNVLTYAYGSCASMVDAQAVFDSVSQPDVVSWSAIIAGYAREGDYAASLQTFEEMQQAGTRSNRITFLLLLSVCSHAGVVDKGVTYFESMTKDYGIIPDEEHYEIMIGLLGRAGDFTKVEDMLSKMLVQPTLSMWLCLLGACQNHGNMLLGKLAFDWAVQLQPKQAAAYVLMSNVHAFAGLQD